LPRRPKPSAAKAVLRVNGLPSAPATRRQRRSAAALLLGFGLVFGLISLVNHYLFRTAGYDLGLATHALHDYARLRPHQTTLLLDQPAVSFLYLHVTLIPALASPLYWVLGSWTLLVVQIGAVLLGGWGVHVFARGQGLGYGAANWLLAYFFSLWGIYSALGFDYHDNVVGAMLLPWLLHWLEQRRWSRAALACGLLLLSKENLALWAAFVLWGVAWKHRRQRGLAAGAVLAGFGALVYFFVVTKVVMPALGPSGQGFTQLTRYQHLGRTLEEAAWNTLTQPRLLWESLFVNIDPDPAYNYNKLETWLVLLLSGGAAVLLRPWYALMLLPLLAQKLLGNYYALWGINNQYSIEFAPVLALAVAETGLLLRERVRRRYYAGTLLLAAAVTLTTLYTRQSKWYQRETTNFLLAKHYRSTAGLDVPRLHAALSRIPTKLPLSAQANLLPWLTERRKLYHYPVLRDAQLVALLKTSQLPWPMSAERYQQSLQELRRRPDFRVRYEDQQLLVLERRGPIPHPDEVLAY
jgi:uncharacterized membrane protein